MPWVLYPNCAASIWVAGRYWQVGGPPAPDYAGVPIQQLKTWCAVFERQIYGAGFTMGSWPILRFMLPPEVDLSIEDLEAVVEPKNVMVIAGHPFVLTISGWSPVFGVGGKEASYCLVKQSTVPV